MNSVGMLFLDCESLRRTNWSKTYYKFTIIKKHKLGTGSDLSLILCSNGVTIEYINT